MSDHHEYVEHPMTHELEHGSWTGYAAITYTAIVIICSGDPRVFGLVRRAQAPVTRRNGT